MHRVLKWWGRARIGSDTGVSSSLKRAPLKTRSLELTYTFACRRNHLSAPLVR